MELRRLIAVAVSFVLLNAAVFCVLFTDSLAGRVYFDDRTLIDVMHAAGVVFVLLVIGIVLNEVRLRRHEPGGTAMPMSGAARAYVAIAGIAVLVVSAATAVTAAMIVGELVDKSDTNMINVARLTKSVQKLQASR